MGEKRYVNEPSPEGVLGGPALSHSLLSVKCVRAGG
jgi:hypothetical protein